MFLFCSITNERRLALEQIGVSARTRQIQIGPGDTVDQQPIRPDMRVTIAYPITLQRMIPVADRKRFLFDQERQQLTKFAEILASLPGQFHVALETTGANGG